MKEKKLAQIKENRERRTGLETYYTNPEVVDICVKEATPFIQESHILVEPCAGGGAFVDGVRRAGLGNFLVAFDLVPRHPEVIQANFFDVSLSVGCARLFAITNPPFGRANSLSVKFFNRLAKTCSFIAVLVPKSWRKWSIQNRLDINFHLVSDIELPLNSFHSPDGTPHDSGVLRTVFQVWERKPIQRNLVSPEDRGYFRKVTYKDADVAFTAFGYGVGKVETDFERRYNSTKLFLKVKDESVVRALREVDVAYFSKNSAYTDVISMEELRSLLNEYYDNLRDSK